jgi:threonine/homoserine efflux transporter RhtA
MWIILIQAAVLIHTVILNLSCLMELGDVLSLYVSMPRMKTAVNVIWVPLSLHGVLALAHVVGVVNPSEKVNGLWLIIAAACIYVLAYWFYGRWLARQVVGLNNQHVATPGAAERWCSVFARAREECKGWGQ